MNTKHHRLLLISLISGGALPFSFAPLHIFMLALISPALLLYGYLQSHNLKQLLLNSYLFALGFFTVGVSWVYVAMHQFGQLNIVASVAISLLFIVVLSVAFILQALIFYYFRQRSIVCQALLVFPATWVICEWLRGWLFTGFPWLELGFSQSNSWLSAYLPVIGSYGVSFLITFSAGLLVLLWRYKKHYWRYLSILAIIWLLAFALSFVRWTHLNGKRLTISMIQGNVPQSIKWQPNQVLPTLTRYQQLTISHWNQLVIWPEAASPILAQEISNYLSRLSAIAKKNHSTIIFGTPTEKNDQFFNSIMAVGRNHGQYDKRHLVPFGEYTPLLLSSLTNVMNLPMSNFSPGAPLQTLIKIDGIAISTLLCYEIAYTSLIRHDMPQAQLLLNLSDDAWFGHSFAAAQQLQIAQTRAKQVGRYLLSVTNNGITAIVNANGNIIARLAPFHKAVLSGTVPMLSGRTPWVIVGDSPVILLMLLLLLIAALESKF